MKWLVISFLFIISSFAFSQAREGEEEDYKSYSVIKIFKEGELQNTFKEGRGIKGKIGNKQVDGVWYFKAEPDLVTVIGLRGKVLGELSLSTQKNLKLETDQPKTNTGISIGVGIGPVGIGTGGAGGGPRFMNYNMEKHQAIFGKQKESREEKIKREYIERKIVEQEEKELAKKAKQHKKMMRKNK